MAAALAAWWPGDADAGSLPAVERRQHKVTLATSNVAVDGVLDEAAWRDAARVSLDWEWFPGDNVPALVSTYCLLTFDSKNFYVGFRAADPAPATIRSYYADRDTPFQDDTVGFVVDPFNDRRRAFQFRVNAVGVQMEAVNSDITGSEDWSWDIIWDAAARITNTGYEVEIAVPFSQLRFPIEPRAQTWGFLAMRDYPRDVRHRLRSTLYDRSLDCFVCQFESVTGFADLSPGRNIEVDPTLTAKRTDERNEWPQGSMEQGRAEVEPGLTGRWSITPNVTGNIALNPDFSHVEADAAQLAVNERFALYFPEKRPFFLEGADLFETLITAVFTRTVADPEAGVKLTGKSGRSAFGVIFARDRINNLVLPDYFGSGLVSVDAPVNSAVLRYRGDVGKTSSAGFLYAGREGEDYYNHAAGFDALLRPAESDTVRANLFFSRTRYAAIVAAAQGQPADRFDGAAGRLSYDHAGRVWSWWGRFAAYSDDFRADSGFIPQTGFRLARAGVSRTIWGQPGGWFSQVQFSADARVTDNIGGEARDINADLGATYLGPLQLEVSYNFSPNRDYFGGSTYRLFRHSVWLAARPGGSFFSYLYLLGGDTIDYANGRAARLWYAEPSVEVQLGKRLHGVFAHYWEIITVSQGRLLEANLTQAKMYCHFSLRSFARVVLQYQSVDRNASLYIDPTDERTRTLATQVLLSYKINPQTLILVGYSDGYLGIDEIDLKQTERTFFTKIGYAWTL
ncbi:MAG: carbohydrate binding family 9 domain-containing protein [Candidatus Schekmanbacteria bacterium]|nr:carbohydrate binding family 9 domain-containing protein [Candidatus Schekmanbacteria bacterium]